MKDYLGKNADSLNEKKLYLFDMDGTIYRENDLFDGVIELLDSITASGGNYAFITNNPSKSVEDYLKKLNALGIQRVGKENFFTSAQAAIMIFKEKFGKGLIYAQGTRSFIAELKSEGLNVTEEVDLSVQAVLVAFDTELTGAKLRNTCEVLTKCDVPYYATNPDWVCPVDFGAIPDCGSMCFGIEKATGKTPFYIGKPQPTMVQELMKKFGVKQSETLVIGDRLYTDIASGNNAGVDTVCVLSGEATLADIQNARGAEKPTFVFESVKNLIRRA